MWDRPDDNEYYIGLMKTEPNVTAPTYWLDGSSSNFRAYDSGEPNEDVLCFVVQDHSPLAMEDQNCASDKRSICKMTNGKIIKLLNVLLSSINSPKQLIVPCILLHFQTRAAQI